MLWVLCSNNAGNGDQSVPEEGGAKGNNSSSESNKSSETASQKSHGRTLDWREFRAALFAGEQVLLLFLSLLSNLFIFRWICFSRNELIVMKFRSNARTFNKALHFIGMLKFNKALHFIACRNIMLGWIKDILTCL